MTARKTPPMTVEGIGEAVEAMDALSHDGFNRINGLAKLCLMSLEVPEGHRSVDALVAALQTICAIAQETRDCINSEAGDVGFGHEDSGWKRRADARRALQDSQRAGVKA